MVALVSWWVVGSVCCMALAGIAVADVPPTHPKAYDVLNSLDEETLELLELKELFTELLEERFGDMTRRGGSLSPASAVHNFKAGQRPRMQFQTQGWRRRKRSTTDTGSKEVAEMITPQNKWALQFPVHRVYELVKASMEANGMKRGGRGRKFKFQTQGWRK